MLFSFNWSSVFTHWVSRSFLQSEFSMKISPVFGGAKRIRGDLLRNVLSFENEEIWRRSCKLWTKVLLVFSCWQTHCLWQPRSFSFYLSIFFRSDFFFRAHHCGIILSWMSGLCCNPLSSHFQIYYIALYALVPIETHFNIAKFNALESFWKSLLLGLKETFPWSFVVVMVATQRLFVRKGGLGPSPNSVAVVLLKPF